MNEAPVAADVMALLDQLGPPPSAHASEVPADELRQGMRDAIALYNRGVGSIRVPHVTDTLVPGRGGKIPVRIYSPDDPTAVIVFFHGGAWVMGDIDTSDLVTRRLSRDTRAIVVSVDYRMLPEHPFPAPLDDAYDATDWASAMRPDLPLVVAGDSAGGSLAAGTTLRARDEDGPRIDGQVLIYPGIDDDFETPSMRAGCDDPRATVDTLRFFIEQYASTETAIGSAYALPGRATVVDGLPPTIVAIAGHDLLRSSEESYAARLQEAGVPVTVQFDPELVHGWIDFAEQVPSAGRAFTRLTDAVNDLIDRMVGSPSRDST
jgi:acetyl esterase